MKRIIPIILLTVHTSYGQIEVIKYSDLENIIESGSNQIEVFNFWATWCKPCIEELPAFEDAQKKYQNQGLKVYLISVDFPEEANGKVARFVAKKGIESQVLVLDETDFNAFIDKVDPSWSGAIPATLIVDNANGKNHFFEKQFKEDELDLTIGQIINQ